MFIETKTDLYFRKYDRKAYSYEPLVRLGIKDIPAIAYASFGMGKQVQVKVDRLWIGFHIIGSNFGDADATRSIYDRLVAGGVAVVEPEPFISMAQPQMTIYY